MWDVDSFGTLWEGPVAGSLNTMINLWNPCNTGSLLNRWVLACQGFCFTSLATLRHLLTADNVSDEYMVNSLQHFCSKLTWLVIQEDFISSRKSVKALQLTKHNYVNKACSCTSHVIHMRFKVVIGLHPGYHSYHRRYSFTVQWCLWQNASH